MSRSGTMSYVVSTGSGVSGTYVGGTSKKRPRSRTEADSSYELGGDAISRMRVNPSEEGRLFLSQPAPSHFFTKLFEMRSHGTPRASASSSVFGTTFSL